MRNKVNCFFITILLLSLSCRLGAATDVPTIKLGVLKFGTVNWTLDIIKQNELDKAHGFNLEIIPLGSKNASAVALQGGSVDVIVSDWLWVSRQRSQNRDYTFVPYSNATGALMVKEGSDIHSLTDLKGKKLGIGGGPVDKSWLFFRAYAQEMLDVDLAEMVEPQFAAPPLLNKLAERGELDATLNFWHYSARLQAAGFRSLLSVSDALKGLGINASVPVIGWVFSEQWAAQNLVSTKGFMRAAHEAQQLLLKDDALWESLRPKMKAGSDQIFNTLRAAYRKGVPACFGVDQKQAARDAFTVLARLGGKKLIGNSSSLSEGTFWRENDLLMCKP